MSKETVIQIVYLPISEIHDYENNPKDNDKAAAAVARSIKRFGVRCPAIVDRDNVLIAGHTRIRHGDGTARVSKKYAKLKG